MKITIYIEKELNIFILVINDQVFRQCILFFVKYMGYIIFDFDDA